MPGRETLKWGLVGVGMAASWWALSWVVWLWA